MLSDLKFAVRSLLKTPGFTLVAVVTMTVAIGACTTVFSLLEAVVLRPLPYPHSDSLVTIPSIYPERRTESPKMTAFKYRMLKEQRDIFQDVAVFAGILVQGKSLSVAELWRLMRA